MILRLRIHICHAVFLSPRLIADPAGDVSFQVQLRRLRGARRVHGHLLQEEADQPLLDVGRQRGEERLEVPQAATLGMTAEPYGVFLVFNAISTSRTWLAIIQNDYSTVAVPQLAGSMRVSLGMS